jgi:hypothetical protein
MGRICSDLQGRADTEFGGAAVVGAARRPSASVGQVGVTTHCRQAMGAAMKARKQRKSDVPSVLDVVALLADLPAEGLARGQVGTIMEQLDDRTFLVEFSDEQGHAYAIAPCPQAELLVLHYVPEAA